MIRLIPLMLLAWSSPLFAEEFLQLSGAQCTTPAYLHCPDENCPADRIINQGAVVEMETRRTYFLDYPCDLKAGEPVTLILSLHGAGSYGNWQRHYFPLLDFKDKYRLVIATPNSPTRMWTEADDGYLENIVETLVDQIGKANVRAFWLVGHSQGGMTSNRILRTPFFAERVDGWMSLSGGRLGGSPGIPAGWGPPRAPGAPVPTATEVADMQARFAAMRALLNELPQQPFSFVFTTGVREMDDAGLPGASKWAQQLACGERTSLDAVVDTKAGYVYDTARQNPSNPSWGALPGPGTASVSQYSGCADGRVVADVVRLEKGHTEGLEPNVTERLVQFMAAAPGGRIQKLP